MSKNLEKYTYRVLWSCVDEQRRAPTPRIADDVGSLGELADSLLCDGNIEPQVRVVC